MRKILWLIWLLAVSPLYAQDEMMNAEIQAKFLLPDEQILFIVGQDLGAIGGMSDYSDGYHDYIELTATGLTTYTDIATLNGLTNRANWGSGDVSAQMLTDEPAYQNSVLSIGLWMSGGNEVLVVNGRHDNQIDRLGAWIKAQNRPVFLRIGYEFDGEWNAYQPEAYVQAFRRIVDRFRAAGVDNVATVWQSATHHSPRFGGHEWSAWYPGDEYVDWFGLSYFEPRLPILNAFLELAREHHKPVMIAESAPKGASTSATTRPELLWNTWYQPFFDFIYANQDVIRAVAYINVDWDAQPMWANSGETWGDSRVQANEVILSNWLAEMNKPVWAHASPDLFMRMGYTPSADGVETDAAWRLVWNDEFEGDTINLDNWNTYLRDLPGAAGERYHNTSYAQYIMDDDVIVENGLLRLQAQRRTITGDNPPGRYEYTAGWVSTHYHFDFTYGYVEVRARFPHGQGIWAAFWMVASDHIWGPEFDVAEYFGNQQRMHFGLMYTEYPEINWNSQNYLSPTWTDDWHIYALEWHPGEAHFLVDGRIHHTILADYVPAEAMYIILQNGVGSAGGVAGAPDAETAFPNSLDVDYVRVYQRESQARILNRGFETGDIQGWEVTPSARVLRRDARSGRFALRLNGQDARAEQVIADLAPNTTYRITAWGKVENAETTLLIGIRDNNGSIEQAQITATDYRQITLTFTTDSSPEVITLFCSVEQGTGDAYCDDFELQVVAPNP
jgi:beta-glucanase (GH16 family)